MQIQKKIRSLSVRYPQTRQKHTIQTNIFTVGIWLSIHTAHSEQKEKALKINRVDVESNTPTQRHKQQNTKAFHPNRTDITHSFIIQQQNKTKNWNSLNVYFTKCTYLPVKTETGCFDRKKKWKKKKIRVLLMQSLDPSFVNDENFWCWVGQNDKIS